MRRDHGVGVDILIFLASIGVFLLAMLVHQEAAHAVAADATPTPEVLYPLHTRVDGKIRIVIDAGPNLHGLRRFAREVDRALPEFQIYTHGTCAARPLAECVTVAEDHYGPLAGWYAQTAMADPHREIQVNLDIPNDHPHAVMCHEFGHVVGLGHHAMHGVDGAWPNEIHLSHAEVSALRNYY